MSACSQRSTPTDLKSLTLIDKLQVLQWESKSKEILKALIGSSLDLIPYSVMGKCPTRFCNSSSPCRWSSDRILRASVQPVELKSLKTLKPEKHKLKRKDDWWVFSGRLSPLLPCLRAQECSLNLSHVQQNKTGIGVKHLDQWCVYAL